MKKETNIENQTENAASGRSASDCSATEGRYERAVMMRSYGRLAEYPECQAEVIANHYAAFAMEAIKLREMVKLKRDARLRPAPELDECIQATMDMIKDHHKMAFGIKLEWPNAQDQPNKH